MSVVPEAIKLMMDVRFGDSVLARWWGGCGGWGVGGLVGNGGE